MQTRIHVPRRTRRLATLGAVLTLTSVGLGACDRDVTSPPTTPSAVARSARAASVAAGGVVTLQYDYGWVSLHPDDLTFRTSDGTVLHLPRAAYDETARIFAAIRQADSVANAAAQVPLPTNPPAPCRPEYQYCDPTVTDPASAGRVARPALELSSLGATNLSTFRTDTVKVGPTGNVQWNCRDIARSLYYATRDYKASRLVYIAALANAGRVVKDRLKQLPSLALPTAWWGLADLFAAPFAVEATYAYMKTAETKMTWLAGMFTMNACLYRSWDYTPVVQYIAVPGQGGGGDNGGTGGGGGAAMWCYYIVTWDGMVEISREYAGCRVVNAN